jgi:hypothetical protein
MQLAAAAPTVVVKTLPVIVHTGGSDPTTTILATVGVVLAVASLVWQAWTFRLSGSRVSVKLRSGMRDLANTAAVTGPNHLMTDQELRLHAQGFTHPVLAVEVKNSGRSHTSIQSVSIQFANGAVYTGSHSDPALPFRLEAENERTWFFERGQTVAYAQAMGQVFSTGSPLTICGSVSLGGRGRSPFSRKSDRSAPDRLTAQRRRRRAERSQASGDQASRRLCARAPCRTIGIGTRARVAAFVRNRQRDRCWGVCWFRACNIRARG